MTQYHSFSVDFGFIKIRFINTSGVRPFIPNSRGVCDSVVPFHLLMDVLLPQLTWDQNQTLKRLWEWRHLAPLRTEMKIFSVTDFKGYTYYLYSKGLLRDNIMLTTGIGIQSWCPHQSHKAGKLRPVSDLHSQQQLHTVGQAPAGCWKSRCGACRTKWWEAEVLVYFSKNIVCASYATRCKCCCKRESWPCPSSLQK